jgi:hypothetical protein
MNEREKINMSYSYFLERESTTTFSLPFFVEDLIIIFKQLGYPFLFLQGKNLLLQKILDPLMIHFNLESLPQEIRTL